MFSAPTSTAPAASSRSIRVASRAAGGRSRLIFAPASVGNPATSNRFFTANGTPASGPSGCPCARAASIACAVSRARTSVKAVNALSTGLRLAMWASVASTTAVARNCPPRTAVAIA
jgi:hypothetical protein